MSHSTSRRRYLQQAAALGALSLSPFCGALAAASPATPRLLLVFLRGGYDSMHLLTPYSSPFYYEARPNIAIAKPGAAQGALALNADWGLHPALADTLYPLYQQGELCFVPFAGTDDVSRSHFETQDSIELGQGAGHGRDLHSGFLNRLAQELGSPESMAFCQQLPLVMQGKLQIPNAALHGGRGNLDARQSDIIANMYQGSSLQEQVKQGFAVRAEVARELQDEMEKASRNAVPAKGFAQEAQRMARLLREKYALGFIDVGGWDTHVNQGGAQGMLAERMQQLAQGLLTLREGMGPMWKNTMVIVISEFGRTMRENGKRGTDHGHGSVYWVLGGAIKGGQIAGRQQAIRADTLFQNRDLPVLNEYRALLGGLFAGVYGLRSEQVARIFPGVNLQQSGLI